MSVSNETRSTSTSPRWVSFDGLRWASEQMARTDLTAGAKLALMAMAAHIRDEDCAVWPSRRRLAAMTGQSVASIDRAIEALQAAGLIAVEGRQSAHGDADTNVYRLLMLGGVNLQPPSRNLQDGVAAKCSPEVNSTTSEVHRTSIARARQQSFDDASEAILGFPIDGPGGPIWPLRQAFLDELSELFPKLDILSECRAALAWVRADASRRKTAKGMRAFLTGWVTRSNDRPRPTTSANGRVPTAAQTLKRRIDASGGDDYLAEAMANGGGHGE